MWHNVGQVYWEQWFQAWSILLIVFGFISGLLYFPIIFKSPLDKGNRPKIICFCGYLRFRKAFETAEYKALQQGCIALLPCCMYVDIEREYGIGDYKLKADELHKRKIDICDEVFVINVNGYIGDSTRSEIEYAKSLGKPIKYMV